VSHAWIDVCSAESDPLGRFRLGPLPAGKHELEVTSSRFPPVKQEVVLGERAASDVRITLAAGAIVRGHVTLPQGVAPGGYLVVAQRSKNDFRGTSLDAQGDFALGPCEPGSYDLIAVPLNALHPDRPGLASEALDWQFQDEIRRVLEARSPEYRPVTVGNQDVRIELVPFDPSRAGSVVPLRGRLAGSWPADRSRQLIVRCAGEQRRFTQRTVPIEERAFDTKVPRAEEYLILVEENYGLGTWLVLARTASLAEISAGELSLETARGRAEITLARRGGAPFEQGARATLVASFEVPRELSNEGWDDCRNNMRPLAIPADGRLSWEDLPAREYGLWLELPGRTEISTYQLAVEAGKTTRLSLVVD
jgi:hypothetical protein